MSVELTVIEHQTQHHNGRPNKSQWRKGRACIDPLLKNLVSNKEQELRQAIQNEKIFREPDGMLRNTFYIVDTFANNNSFLQEYYPQGSNGVCVEVVITMYGENLKADIHGFPVEVKKVGISLSMSELCE